MLRELWIENLALIEKAHLELDQGFTVLTGETGSGKSLIVSALDLALGSRARAEVVRKGAPRAFVAARFEPPPSDLASEAEDGALLITRTISAAGKSKATLNDRPITLSRLRDLGSHLADLHGQHEQQSILKPDAQRRLLDAYARAGEALAAVQKAYRAARDLRGQLDTFLEERRRGREEREFWSYQLAELKACEITSGQEARLSAERRRLAGSGKLRELLEESRGLLDDDAGSITALLNRVTDLLESAADIDPRWRETLSQLEEARVSIEDAGRQVSSWDDEEADPGRLEFLEERLAALAALRRKHKTDEAGLVALQADLVRRLDAQENAEHHERSLRRELEAAGRTLAEAARELTRKRTRSAARLAREVAGELLVLGMPEARIRIDVEPLGDGLAVEDRRVGPQGAETVSFHFAPNPGESGGSLAALASGGELSRVMLALKNVLRQVDPVPVVLFDEIDTGIGGMVAEAVGTRLKRIAENRQVIVVTHAALIAGRADHHLCISKESKGRTTVRILALEGRDRESELARMLAGSSLESARPAAKSLLQDRP